MPAIITVGAQWGDEGKGKIVDFLASSSNMVVRSQGGDNAGHTIKFNNQSFSLKLIPSGILNENVRCLIGSGVVVNLKNLIDEMEQLQNVGVNLLHLKLDYRTNLILPWHKALDALFEKKLNKNNVGTTKKGIGPCYSDAVGRFGIKLIDLIQPEIFKEKVNFIGNLKNSILTQIFNEQPLNLEEIIEEHLKFVPLIKPFLTDVSTEINLALNNNETVLLEGAQGALLDVNFGTYPFVTSSNSIASGILAGAGMGPTKVKSVIGICKAYSTRVGQGPFPTEFSNETSELIIEKGHEFGTNTKRVRRIGWLDCVALKHAQQINGFTELAINKLDVLRGINPLKICVNYLNKSEKVTNFPASNYEFNNIIPEFVEFEGFTEDISDCRNFQELPSNCKNFITAIQKICDTKISFIGVGPDRNQIITT